jgi:hypothetical protein
LYREGFIFNLRRITMRRCPACFGIIHKKAVRCKHCNADLNPKNANEGNLVSYINNGFALINKECEEFEAKIDRMKGKHFSRHEYSEEELVHSNHIDKIKSIAGKMGSDIENWKIRGLVPGNVYSYYENKIEILKQRMTYMMERLKFRRKTVWDSIGEFFLSTYYFIFNIAFYHFRNVAIPAMGSDSAMARTFNAFNQAAEQFEDFINSMNSPGGQKEGPGFSTNKDRA